MSFGIEKFSGPSQRETRLVVVLIATVLITGAISLMHYRSTKLAVERINYSQLYALAEAGSATGVVIDNDALLVTRLDGTIVESTVAGESFRQTVVELFRKNHIPVEFASTQPGLAMTVVTYSWPILVLALFGFVGWRVYATVNGRTGNFNLSDHRGKQKTTFADVAGVDEGRAGGVAIGRP